MDLTLKCVQPATQEPRESQDSSECSPTLEHDYAIAVSKGGTYLDFQSFESSNLKHSSEVSQPLKYHRDA